MKSFVNRPSRFGPKNREVASVQESEVAFVAINDDKGNPIYIGRAIVGSALNEARWQIRKITYDANNAVTRIQWPVNTEGKASSDFEFIWNSAATYTYQ